MKESWWRGALAAPFLLAACGGPPPSGGCEPTQAAVLSIAEGLVAADNRSDLESVMAHYADDITFVTPEGDLVGGRSTIRPRYEELFERFTVDIAMEAEEVGVDDEWAFLRGRNVGSLTSRSTGDVAPLRDRFLMILRCEGDAGWKISRLIWVHER